MAKNLTQILEEEKIGKILYEMDIPFKIIEEKGVSDVILRGYYSEIMKNDIEKAYSILRYTGDIDALQKLGRDWIKKEPKLAYSILREIKDDEGLRKLGRSCIKTNPKIAYKIANHTKNKKLLSQARARIIKTEDLKEAYNFLITEGIFAKIEDTPCDQKGLIQIGEKLLETEPELAYHAFNQAKSEEGLSRARARIIEIKDSKTAMEIFKGPNRDERDREGLKLLGRKMIETDPYSANGALQQANDREGLIQLGKAIIEKNPELAYHAFNYAKDVKGPSEAIAKILEKDPKEAYDFITRYIPIDSKDAKTNLSIVGIKLLEIDPELAYRAFQRSEDRAGLLKARLAMVQENPVNAYKQFIQRGDGEGKSFAIESIAKKYDVNQENLEKALL